MRIFRHYHSADDNNNDDDARGSYVYIANYEFAIGLFPCSVEQILMARVGGKEAPWSTSRRSSLWVNVLITAERYSDYAIRHSCALRLTFGNDFGVNRIKSDDSD